MTQKSINFGEDERIEMALPWPPTVNHYWTESVRKINGKYVVIKTLSKRAKDFRWEVISIVRKMKIKKRIAGGVKILVLCHPPDKKERDLDNLTKGLFDALQHAGVYYTDFQIEQFTMARRPVVKGGVVKVRIERI